MARTIKAASPSFPLISSNDNFFISNLMAFVLLMEFNIIIEALCQVTKARASQRTLLSALFGPKYKKSVLYSVLSIQYAVAMHIHNSQTIFMVMTQLSFALKFYSTIKYFYLN
jgi:hypothetical protein